jgi:hypothetical protein
VTKVDTRFQHLTHGYCHGNSPKGFSLKPAATSSTHAIYVCAKDTLEAPVCDFDYLHYVLSTTILQANLAPQTSLAEFLMCYARHRRCRTAAKARPHSLKPSAHAHHGFPTKLAKDYTIQTAGFSRLSSKSCGRAGMMRLWKIRQESEQATSMSSLPLLTLSQQSTPEKSSKSDEGPSKPLIGSRLPGSRFAVGKRMYLMHRPKGRADMGVDARAV